MLINHLNPVKVIQLYKNMNQTNIVEMTADTSRRIWKSMSNWRLYSFNQNELNRRVQEPGLILYESYSLKRYFFLKYGHCLPSHL